MRKPQIGDIWQYEHTPRRTSLWLVESFHDKWVSLFSEGENHRNERYPISAFDNSAWKFIENKSSKAKDFYERIK